MNSNSLLVLLVFAFFFGVYRYRSKTTALKKVLRPLDYAADVPEGDWINDAINLSMAFHRLGLSLWFILPLFGIAIILIFFR